MAGSSERFVCIHGHFYQPPRENPWLDAIEVQDSAAPYHDWNERITAECYAPNAVARRLDAQERITALRNNYEHLSFNFGPTLLTWMERARPDVYGRILLADRRSARRLGHGNALAQVYGHCIMPLATPRDQQTQVRWGIADFVHRFGRRPDGMWLPETAVDRHTLTVLAENGIRFTILAPSQAARVRYAEHDWQDVRDGGIDTTRPYRCAVGAGRTITIFFYDAQISHAIAFGGLLNDGHELARRLSSAVTDKPGPQLVHIATDGESYGHHHRFGEMALASAIEALEGDGAVELTNYATYLDRFPARDEVVVRDQSSWSCAHGVERWRTDCGCNTGGQPDWQQAWRTPLREALDWLKVQLDALYERHGAPLLRDPWAARDAYLGVLLKPGAATREAFIERYAAAPPPRPARPRLWKLLEMQRHALLSFTSCGWFFDEPSGIETVQILTYAARALQLAAELGAPLEPEFLRRLQPMRSNLPGHADGRQIYRRLVRPQIVEPARLIAHYAMLSLFEPSHTPTRIYAYRVTPADRRMELAGAVRFTVGRAHLLATATDEDGEHAFAALHLGGHDMHCVVSPRSGTDDADRSSALMDVFRSEPLPELMRQMDAAVGAAVFTLRDMFGEERRRILEHIAVQTLAAGSAEWERMVRNNGRLLDFLVQTGVPLPVELRVATTLVMQHRLEEAATAFSAGTETAERLMTAATEAQRWRLTPPTDTVRRQLEDALARAVREVAARQPESAMARALAVLDVAQRLDLTLNTWEAQNQYYAFVTTAGDRRFTPTLLAELRRLGERLSFRLREWEAFAARAA